MSFDTLSLDELRANLMAHETTRPANAEVEALRKWVLVKEKILYWIETRQSEASSRWHRVYIEEKAVNVPQPSFEGVEASLQHQVEALREAASMGFTLGGAAQKKQAVHCSHLRRSIRQYCLKHGLEVPPEAVTGWKEALA